MSDQANDFAAPALDESVSGIYDGTVAPKSAKSAWMLYTSQQRNLVITEYEAAGKDRPSMTGIIKILGERFRNLSDEERELLNESARVEKLRFTKELELFKSLNPNASVSIAQVDSNVGPSNSSGLILPLARVRKTIKLDKDVVQVNKAAVLAIGKATELFIQQLALRTYSDVLQTRRKGNSIKDSDISHTVNLANNAAFHFLAADFPNKRSHSQIDGNHSVSNNSSNSKKAKVNKLADSNDVDNVRGNKLTSFFHAA